MSARDKSLFASLRLSRCEGIGPIRYFGLITKYGDAETALKELPNIITKTGNSKFKIAAVSQIEDEIEKTTRFGGRFFLTHDSEYPIELRNINPPPPIISAIGNFSLLSKPKIAMVGARNASMVGIKIARDLAANLSKAGYIIVSGLARGIDGAAHVASINSGTIAVVAGGIDHIYPPEHAELYERIKDVGLIVSENPFGAPVFARDFPRRNRIISGLSLGVIIVEAEEKSGSLITARFANEQGREVFAIPGSPLDPRAFGPNQLIKDGATLITNAQDVLDAFANYRQINEPEFDFSPAAHEICINNDLKNDICALLSPVPISIDEIARHTNLPWRMVAAIIVELELESRAFFKNGNLVSNTL